MGHYNDNPNIVIDKTDELFSKMNDLKENMVENINSLVERDGKIEVIAEKALNLSVVSNSFHKQSKKLKERERNRRYCQLAAIIFCGVVLLGFILYAIFGGGSDSKDEPKKEDTSAVKAQTLVSDLFLQIQDKFQYNQEMKHVYNII